MSLIENDIFLENLYLDFQEALEGKEWVRATKLADSIMYIFPDESEQLREELKKFYDNH